MRIIHVMHHSLPGSDGYSIRAKYLLEAQVAAGHEVTVLTSPAQGQEAKEEVINGIRYCRSPYLAWERERIPSGAKHLVFGRAIGRRLKALMSQTRFDLVHAHTPFTVARPALREARRQRIPFVYEKRNLWEESAVARGKVVGRWPWYQIARALDMRLTFASDAVCTITQALKDHTVKLGARPEDVFVVGNGVDTDAFVPHQAPEELRRQCTMGGDFVIGFIGSFFTFEGLPMLMEAFAGLRTEYPNARLVLVGDGEDKAKLDRMFVDLKLEGAAWLVGRVPHAQVNGFCASMDALVYPRTRSPLTEMISPLKPLEPMAMARCVIGSDVGGIRELIRDGQTGLLFQADSRESLQAKLKLVLSRQVDVAQLGANAREDMLANRQWRHMSAAYEPAYAHARSKAAKR